MSLHTIYHFYHILPYWILYFVDRRGRVPHFKRVNMGLTLVGGSIGNVPPLFHFRITQMCRPIIIIKLYLPFSTCKYISC